LLSGKEVSILKPFFPAIRHRLGRSPSPWSDSWEDYMCSYQG